MKEANGFKLGDRIRFTAQFCRSTGQYAGPEAPTSVGPWARGEVVQIDTPFSRYEGGPRDRGMLGILWDDGRESMVLNCNLEVIKHG